MTAWDEKVRVALGGFSLELPVSLAKQPGTPVDSLAGRFEGSGLSVIVDQGPFSDRLSSYVGRPDYQEEAEEIAGVPARIVFFRTPEEGTYTVAAHMPGLNNLTVFVRAAESVPQSVARDIIQSVEPVG
jgi:hypothetical protein